MAFLEPADRGSRQWHFSMKLLQATLHRRGKKKHRLIFRGFAFPQNVGSYRGTLKPGSLICLVILVGCLESVPAYLNASSSLQVAFDSDDPHVISPSWLSANLLLKHDSEPTRAHFGGGLCLWGVDLCPSRPREH